jgi:SAM-dependent methyltransferase
MSPELSDLILAVDSELRRTPVSRDAVVEALRAADNPRGAAIAATLPARGELLDDEAVDALLVQAHAELQRLHEEFQHGHRVRRLLGPLLAALRATGHTGPLRVVDIGCGLGFVVRWLAAHGGLGDDVELVGCDLNAALVDGAQRLARAEDLRCRFVQADAFALDLPATVYLSTGVVHHFRDAALVRFFAAQATASTRAFAHWDITPTWAAPLGAWLFHQARMRLPLARHDGILSARRAHPDAALLAACQVGAPGFAARLFARPHPLLPMLRVLRPVVGLRPELEAPLRAALGREARLLVDSPARSLW